MIKIYFGDKEMKNAKRVALCCLLVLSLVVVFGCKKKAVEGQAAPAAKTQAVDANQ
jgi:hypothetical protein